ncbi:PepSY domain-containing protein [Micromonospora sp. SL1-18]|uniref:PepSY domain-containing protein n=1 Tax=Micromonospora sp. SL1-18 TaxID=3399128 RepID=UPI003A4D2514
MRRTSLVLAAAGGAAVLAVTGVALGVTTADRPGPDTLAAATANRTTDDNPKLDDDATSATTTEDRPKPDDDARATTAAPSRAAGGTVSGKRAGEVALARLGGGRIVEIEAELEHGRPVWSVEVVKGAVRYEVKVDRGDGTVVETERERTDDRGGDGRHRDDHGGTRTGTDGRYDD